MALKLVIFLGALVCSNARTLRNDKLGPRIVGGEDAEIEDFPYQISLMIDGSHQCGGSILNDRFVLTAAHCTYETTADQLQVRAGSSMRDQGGVVVNVLRIYQHDDFDIDTYDYDVSVLELDGILTFSNKIGSIDIIGQGEEIRDDDNAVATGWGRLSDGGPLSSQLQKVILPTISTGTCEQYYGSGSDGITERMYCAGYRDGGKDTCQGDSGGPLARDKILIGIVSWGDVCAAAERPGVYTKLSYFSDYVKSIINS